MWLVCVWRVSAHVCVFVEKKGKEGEYRKTRTLRKETAGETVYSAGRRREGERDSGEKLTFHLTSLTAQPPQESW